MLPKANRLITEAQFKKVARGSRPTHSKHLLLKKIALPQQATKFGIVISSKVSKKAVIRNKIRRRIREVIRARLLEITPGYQVMLVVKNSILEKDFKEIKIDLEGLLKKTKLL